MASYPHAKYQSVVGKDEQDAETEIGDGDVEKSALVRPSQIASDRIEEPSSSCLSFQLCSLKMLVLGLVVLQNTGYALVRRYSRGALHESYSTSSVLLVMEVSKLLLSAVQIVVSEEPSDVPEGSPLSKYLFLVRNGLVMAVPAAIYLVMNILGFVALAHIDAATFSIVSQMKVFSTAIFSVLVLGRRLAPRKWRALVTLTLGVMLISHEGMPSSSAAGQRALSEYLLGLGACLGDVLLSGFVSIYFEKVLKSTTETFSVWDRNFQLAFWSLLIYTPIMLYDNPSQPFTGWTPMAVVCAVTGGLGGVLVALSIKLADSIMKTIATTGAIVLTTVLNAAFLHGPFTVPIATGALVVVVSVCNYNDSGDP